MDYLAGNVQLVIAIFGLYIIMLDSLLLSRVKSTDSVHFVIIYI